MPWQWILPLALSALTTGVVAGRRVFSDFAQVIRLLTRLEEKIGLAQVGVETLGIVDLEVKTQLREIQQRLDDIERYIQLTTAESERPFIVRYRDRK